MNKTQKRFVSSILVAIVAGGMNTYYLVHSNSDAYQRHPIAGVLEVLLLALLAGVFYYWGDGILAKRRENQLKTTLWDSKAKTAKDDSVSSNNNLLKWIITISAVIGIVLFAWAFRFQYDHWRERPIRTNRYTGESEILEFNGWKPLEKNPYDQFVDKPSQ